MRKSKSQMNRQLFLMYGMGLVMVIYFSIVYAPYIHGTFADWFVNIRSMERADYFHFTIDAHTLKVTAMVSVAYGFIIFIYHLSRRNYRRGEEHGSAQWGNPHKICRKYRQRETKEPDSEQRKAVKTV